MIEPNRQNFHSLRRQLDLELKQIRKTLNFYKTNKDLVLDYWYVTDVNNQAVNIEIRADQVLNQKIYSELSFTLETHYPVRSIDDIQQIYKFFEGIRNKDSVLKKYQLLQPSSLPREPPIESGFFTA